MSAMLSFDSITIRTFIIIVMVNQCFADDNPSFFYYIYGILDSDRSEE